LKYVVAQHYSTANRPYSDDNGDHIDWRFQSAPIHVRFSRLPPTDTASRAGKKSAGSNLARFIRLMKARQRMSSAMPGGVAALD
jgi:hypothetical protein